MNNSLKSNDDVRSWMQSNEVLKLTSLIYLKEALLAQQYEDCASLIQEAKSLGAQPGEISAVISQVYEVLIRGASAHRAKTKNKNRLRF